MPKKKPPVSPEIVADAIEAAASSEHMRNSPDRDKATEGHLKALTARLGRAPTPHEQDAWELAFWGALGEDFA